jgi:hypothetical protein
MSRSPHVEAWQLVEKKFKHVMLSEAKHPGSCETK